MAPRPGPRGPGRRPRQLAGPKPATRGPNQSPEQLFAAHRSLVEKEASARAGRGLSAQDLLQEASLALVAAIHDYQGDPGPPFEAYAERRVAEHLEAALEAEAAARREEAGVVAESELFQRVEVLLARDLGRPATDAELAEKLEWSLERVATVGEMVRRARRRHDETLLEFLDPAEMDLDSNGGRPHDI